MIRPTRHQTKMRGGACRREEGSSVLREHPPLLNENGSPFSIGNGGNQQILLATSDHFWRVAPMSERWSSSTQYHDLL